jgi:hypothetical protein
MALLFDDIQIYFKLQIGFYPVALWLRYNTNTEVPYTIQISNTNTHITQDNTTKQNKEKQASPQSYKKVKDILEAMDRA